jgi:hypothetical protein
MTPNLRRDIKLAQDLASSKGVKAVENLNQGNTPLAIQYSKSAWHWACYAERNKG